MNFRWLLRVCVCCRPSPLVFAALVFVAAIALAASISSIFLQLAPNYCLEIPDWSTYDNVPVERWSGEWPSVTSAGAYLPPLSSALSAHYRLLRIRPQSSGVPLAFDHGGGGSSPESDEDIPVLFVHGHHGPYEAGSSLATVLHAMAAAELGATTAEGEQLVRQKRSSGGRDDVATDTAADPNLVPSPPPPKSTPAGFPDDIRPRGGRKAARYAVYTIQFAEAQADSPPASPAFHAPTLLAEAAFVNDAVRVLARMHRRCAHVPIVAHSMGGVASHLALMLPNHLPGSMSTIITLASPHAAHPYPLDEPLEALYAILRLSWMQQRQLQGSLLASSPGGGNADQRSQQIRREDAPSPIGAVLNPVVLVSICGGPSDTIIRPELTTLEGLVPRSHGTTISLGAVPGVWLQTDHDGIFNCGQFIVALARALDALKGSIVVAAPPLDIGADASTAATLSPARLRASLSSVSARLSTLRERLSDDSFRTNLPHPWGLLHESSPPTFGRGSKALQQQKEQSLSNDKDPGATAGASDLEEDDKQTASCQPLNIDWRRDVTEQVDGQGGGGGSLQVVLRDVLWSNLVLSQQQGGSLQSLRLQFAANPSNAGEHELHRQGPAAAALGGTDYMDHGNHSSFVSLPAASASMLSGSETDAHFNWQFEMRARRRGQAVGHGFERTGPPTALAIYGAALLDWARSTWSRVVLLGSLSPFVRSDDRGEAAAALWVRSPLVFDGNHHHPAAIVLTEPLLNRGDVLVTFNLGASDVNSLLDDTKSYTRSPPQLCLPQQQTEAFNSTRSVNAATSAVLAKSSLCFAASEAASEPLLVSPFAPALHQQVYRTVWALPAGHCILTTWRLPHVLSPYLEYTLTLVPVVAPAPEAAPSSTSMPVRPSLHVSGITQAGARFQGQGSESFFVRPEPKGPAAEGGGVAKSACGDPAKFRFFVHIFPGSDGSWGAATSAIPPRHILSLITDPNCAFTVVLDADVGGVLGQWLQHHGLWAINAVVAITLLLVSAQIRDWIAMGDGGVGGGERAASASQGDSRPRSSSGVSFSHETREGGGSTSLEGMQDKASASGFYIEGDDAWDFRGDQQSAASNAANVAGMMPSAAKGGAHYHLSLPSGQVGESAASSATLAADTVLQRPAPPSVCAALAVHWPWLLCVGAFQSAALWALSSAAAIVAWLLLPSSSASSSHTEGGGSSTVLVLRPPLAPSDVFVAFVVATGSICLVVFIAHASVWLVRAVLMEASRPLRFVWHKTVLFGAGNGGSGGGLSASASSSALGSAVGGAAAASFVSPSPFSMSISVDDAKAAGSTPRASASTHRSASSSPSPRVASVGIAGGAVTIRRKSSALFAEAIATNGGRSSSALGESSCTTPTLIQRNGGGGGGGGGSQAASQFGFSPSHFAAAAAAATAAASVGGASATPSSSSSSSSSASFSSAAAMSAQPPPPLPQPHHAGGCSKQRWTRRACIDAALALVRRLDPESLAAWLLIGDRAATRLSAACGTAALATHARVVSDAAASVGRRLASAKVKQALGAVALFVVGYSYPWPFVTGALSLLLVSHLLHQALLLCCRGCCCCCLRAGDATSGDDTETLLLRRYQSLSFFGHLFLTFVNVLDIIHEWEMVPRKDSMATGRVVLLVPTAIHLLLCASLSVDAAVAALPCRAMRACSAEVACGPLAIDRPRARAPPPAALEQPLRSALNFAQAAIALLGWAHFSLCHEALFRSQYIACAFSLVMIVVHVVVWAPGRR